MMSLWDALRMNMMISYQELVRTFLSNNSSSKIFTEVFAIFSFCRWKIRYFFDLS
jgi:hypothetical protein